MHLTKAVTHIKIHEANHGKLAALDVLAQAYMILCQQYVTLFCTESQPDKFAAPIYTTDLSQRWQRVAIQQAAGIAKSWRTNRENAYYAYLEELAAYQEQQAELNVPVDLKEPIWKEWNTPTLKQVCIQANINVVSTKTFEEIPLALEPSECQAFDYWLKVSTLEAGKPIYLPIKLSTYHKQQLAGKKLNTSTTLNKRADGWWLTFTYDEEVPVQNNPQSPIVGVDVGIAHFITSSTGRHYGTFRGRLAHRHKLDREKRRRKDKLRTCLKKKGVTYLPSLSNKRLSRSVRQEINRAINQFFNDHPGFQIAYEALSAASMKFKARQMNAYLYASNLAHIPKQLAWATQKRGMRAIAVKSAYSSQECNHCHYTARANRPNQQTFCCVVCGYKAHADYVASLNIQQRLGDSELAKCQDSAEVKALLNRRHQSWLQSNGWP